MNNPYENLVSVMRQQGLHDAPAGIQLAVMVSANSCKIGNLTLLPADLYIPDRLMAASCTKAAGTCHDGANFTDKSTYSPALKAGDTVVVYPLSDQKYIILERVVPAG